MTVHAQAADNKVETYSTYAPSATITFTVVRGITDLAITGVPSKVMKGKGAVSLKAGVIYNRDWTGKDKNLQPKSKKVTWSLKDVSAGLIGYVSINAANGAIKIDKNYVANDADSFVVVAKAADYAANTVVAETPEPVQIVTSAEKAKDIVLIRGEDVLSDGCTIPANAVGGVSVMVRGANDESMNSQYSFKVNNKAVVVDPEGNLDITGTFTKELKNVTITATALNGSKDKKTIKFTVGYAEVKAVGLRVTVNGTEYENAGSVTYYGSPSTVIDLEVISQDEDGYWDDAPYGVNAKLALKGGLKLIDGKGTNHQKVVLTKDSGQVVLNGATYTITNAGFSKAKAPKVKDLSNGNYQVVLGKGQTAYPDSVLVEAIPADYQKSYTKKDGKYTVFCHELGLVPYKINNYNNYDYYSNRKIIKVESNGTFNVGELSSSVPKGSYKLQMTFGARANGEFVGESKSFTTAWKVKGATGKTVTTYTLSLSDRANAEFVGGRLDELLNANLTGQSNHFLDFFELVKVDENGTVVTDEKAGYDHFRIGIKAGADFSKAEANDYTGYAFYVDSTGEKYAMIKVVVTDGIVGKYSLSKPSVLLGSDNVAEIEVTDNKAAVNLASAKVTDNGGLTLKGEPVVAGNKIRLTIDGAKVTEAKSYNLVLSIVTAASQNKKEVTGLKTSIKTVKEEGTKNKVKFDPKKILVVSYNKETGKYEGSVGYTQSVYAEAKVSAGGFTGTAKNGVLSVELTKAKYAEGVGAIKNGKLDITLDFGGKAAKETASVPISMVSEKPQTLQEAADLLKAMRDDGRLVKDVFAGLGAEATLDQLKKAVMDNVIAESSEVTDVDVATGSETENRKNYTEFTLKTADGKTMMVAVKNLRPSGSSDKAYLYLQDAITKLKNYLAEEDEDGNPKNLWTNDTVSEEAILAKATELAKLPAEYKLEAEWTSMNLATDKEPGQYSSYWKLTKDGKEESSSYISIGDEYDDEVLIKQLADLSVAEEAINTAITKYVASNETDQGKLLEAAKEAVEALGNKAITVEVAKKLKAPTEDAFEKDDEGISITFLLKNPETKHSEVAFEVREVTKEISFNNDRGTLEQYLKDALKDVDIQDIAYASNYDNTAGKAAFIAKAEETIGNSLWKVSETDTKFEITAPTKTPATDSTPEVKTPGKVVYQLKVTYQGTVEEGSKGPEAIVIPAEAKEVELPESLKTLTLETAKTNVEKKLETELAKVNTAKTEAQLLEEIEDLIKEELGDSGITRKFEGFKDDYTLKTKTLVYTPSTVTEAGSVSLKLQLKKDDVKGEVEEKTYKLAMIHQTLEQAKAAAEAAVNKLSNTADATEANVTAAIKGAINGDITLGSLTKLEGSDSVTVAATEEKTGTIKGTVELSRGEETKVKVDVNIVIPKLAPAAK